MRRDFADSPGSPNGVRFFHPLVDFEPDGGRKDGLGLRTANADWSSLMR